MRGQLPRCDALLVGALLIAVRRHASTRNRQRDPQPSPPDKPVAITVNTGAQAAQQGTTLDFANARLADVIRTIATMLGRTVLTSDIPDVRITFSTAAPVRPANSKPSSNRCSSRTT
jgi:hypothetical protein